MKDKDIREYIHYYLGCECTVRGHVEEVPIKLTGISWDDQTGHWWCYFENTETAYALIEDVAPLLYRLEDINYAQLLAVAQADNYYKFNSWDEAVETAKESGSSLLAKQGLNESTTLILKSTQLL